VLTFALVVLFGHTRAGRYLVCVYEPIDEATLYPITANEPEDNG
jgi:hypothetical protein